MSFKDWVGQPGGSSGILGVVSGVIIPFIFTLAFIIFIWGVVNYMFINGASEEKRVEGRQFMFYGILGMALLFSVWGVLNLLLATLGLGTP
jgi:heme/copper-type cytochrome/quinol oxidase subunit 4